MAGIFVGQRLLCLTGGSRDTNSVTFFVLQTPIACFDFEAPVKSALPRNNFLLVKHIFTLKVQFSPILILRQSKSGEIRKNAKFS